jgi:single-stranded-DNA-specific exonuclease
MQMIKRTRMYARRRWNIAQASVEAAELARSLGTSMVTAQILINRGLVDPADARSFLTPQLRDLIEPSLLPGVPAAAERIARAVREREKIVIYGDYDVDGITATAILWHSLKALEADVHYYIPHRIEEGYGLNAEAVKTICDGGANLLITVDCGITAIEPVKVARERGVDVIITDHHEWKTEEAEVRDQKSEVKIEGAVELHAKALLPDALLVHPRLPGHEPAYANPCLCGAGVAFKLAWGVGQALGVAGKVPDVMKPLLVEMTALAALGTIADVVPLVAENRILARYGLGGLKQSKLNGIRALITACQLDGQKLDSFHVGFLLAPRLNAAGRMGHARLAVEMLTDASPQRAVEIATYLESQNKLRQATEREILDQAIEQAHELKMTGDDCHAIVLASTGWHPGVIGIVASRIVDRFHKPTIMIALSPEGHGHGSGRSINGFHLSKALDVCKMHLKTCGGHEMAAGLAIDAANLDAFRTAFLEHAKGALTAEQMVPELRIDTVAELDQVSHALVTEFERLGPFGQGNPKPLIACRGLTLTAAPKRVGKKGEHLQLFVRQGNRFMKCIAFNASDLFEQLQPGKPIDLAVQPQLNEWNGTVNVELEVKDIFIPS